MNNHLESVVLVDERNAVLGTALKSEVHTAHTPLHRGFSVFLFDDADNVLLQQRSRHKFTWPLVWAGSCCGHPAPGESVESAIRRRAAYELGIVAMETLQEILPDFRYECVRDGIRENEICPVWAGRIRQTPQPNAAEVEAVQWLPWRELVSQIQDKPGTYAEWCELEVMELCVSPVFRRFLEG
jgi:isopentenyl-diphosphate delta-isomerase